MLSELYSKINTGDGKAFGLVFETGKLHLCSCIFVYVYVYISIYTYKNTNKSIYTCTVNICSSMYVHVYFKDMNPNSFCVFK